MSLWTHVFGIIEVSSYEDSPARSRCAVEVVLEHQPKVTGSEGNMNVSLLATPGSYDWSSCNEFGEWRDRGIKIPNQYSIILSGDLRDRIFEQTKRELTKWLVRLSKRLWVRKILVRLDGECGESLVFNDARPFSDMNEIDMDVDGEIPWLSHLFGDYDPYTGYPLGLLEKYYNDPEIDAEMRRRREFLQNRHDKRRREFLQSG